MQQDSGSARPAISTHDSGSGSSGPGGAPAISEARTSGKEEVAPTSVVGLNRLFSGRFVLDRFVVDEEGVDSNVRTPILKNFDPKSVLKMKEIAIHKIEQKIKENSTLPDIEEVPHIPTLLDTSRKIETTPQEISPTSKDYALKIVDEQWRFLLNLVVPRSVKVKWTNGIFGGNWKEIVDGEGERRFTVEYPVIPIKKHHVDGFRFEWAVQIPKHHVDPNNQVPQRMGQERQDVPGLRTPAEAEKRRELMSQFKGRRSTQIRIDDISPFETELVYPPNILEEQDDIEVLSMEKVEGKRESKESKELKDVFIPLKQFSDILQDNIQQKTTAILHQYHTDVRRRRENINNPGKILVYDNFLTLVVPNIIF